ncbi:unnamed protein product [Orchesella dallaii]|uniref:Uncharacterized protein n=1 Tax=Orchesella dallaii TaxID=48710 RepID=A0ABP1R5I6_9HEXA
MSLIKDDDEEWLANHLSLGKDGQISNPLNPVPPLLKHVEGIEKLRRALAKELANPHCVRDKSSNLPHLLSIIKCVWPRANNRVKSEGFGGIGGVIGGSHNDILPKCPSAVLKPFVYSESRTGRLVVDIVSCDGDTWYKISARNPKSLALVASGGGGYGKKSIVDHAIDYMQCAEENPCLFKPPKIVVIFTSGISDQVAEELESMGVDVIGKRIDDTELELHPRIKVLQESDTQALQKSPICQEILGDSSNKPSKMSNPSLDGVERLNLDISTLLAYLSNLTNGHTNVKFKKKILSDQADDERLRPQKPVLDKIFEGIKKSIFHKNFRMQTDV